MTLLIRADCTQLGLWVEASQDDGETWQTVQLSRYNERPSPTVQQYSTYIDPAHDRAEYFTALRKRGIQFTEVQS